jgi:hypothetical protein
MNPLMAHPCVGKSDYIWQGVFTQPRPEADIQPQQSLPC